MKKLFFICLSLFMMNGFLPAKEQTEKVFYECFGTTCGEGYCSPPLSPELTNSERLLMYKLAEFLFCGDRS